MPTPTSVIIDCDPGVDDAIALFLAFAAPELDILAITSVAGNVGIEHTSRNARIIRQMAGRQEVPVYAGCTRPLFRVPVEAGEFHGANGLGPIEPFEPETPLAPGHAVNVLIETIMNQPKRSTTLVITGPMTNVALALRMEPRLAEHLGPVIIMGGARSEGGNITPTAEFNICADPHAAEVVFSAGLQTVVFGLDVTHQVRATPPRTAAMHALTTPVGRTTAQLLDFANQVELDLVGGIGTPLHDPCTIVWLLQPELFTTVPCSIQVETSSPLTAGCTAVNFRPAEGAAARCRWVTGGDAEGVFGLLAERLG